MIEIPLNRRSDDTVLLHGRVGIPPAEGPVPPHTPTVMNSMGTAIGEKTGGPLELSVIIVTFNRGPTLLRTLESVLAQSPAAREVIVVDQTREHEPAVRNQLRQWSERGDIQLLFQELPNAQRARNRAIAEATCDVLLFLDDDVILEPGMMAAHMANYTDPMLAAVCGYYTEPGEVPLDTLPDYCQRRWTGWIHTPHCYTKRLECHLFPSCNGSIRREVIRRLGGFDENYTHTLLDDTDLACRLKAAGHRAVHDPKARLVHLKEPSGGKRPGGLNQHVLADANRWFTWCYFYWMNFGWRGVPELARNFRRCVLRKVNLQRPWYFIIAMVESVRGACRAVSAVLRGRRLARFAE